MSSEFTNDKKRITSGILIGILYLFLAAGITAMAFLMVSVMIMGCRKSPPDWVFMIVFIGFPLPLLISTIIVPYLYIKRSKVMWLIIVSVLGIFLSCVIYLVWFLVLTQYC